MQSRSVKRFFPILLAIISLLTICLFFVTQRFKQEPPPLDNAWATRNFSPNSDGVKDTARFGFSPKKQDHLSVSITTSDGSSIRDLLKNRSVGKKERVTLAWDGKTDEGTFAGDGRYWVRVSFHRQARAFMLAQTITKDTVAPRPRILAIRPEKGSRPELLPRQDNQPAEIRYRTAERRPKVSVFRTDTNPVQRVLGPIVVPPAVSPKVGRWTWDGKRDGKLVPDGTYLVMVSARDQAGNLGTSAGEPWPKISYGKRFPRRAGITVRSLAVQTPNNTVRAGEKMLAAITAPNTAYRWKLLRFGKQRAVVQGKGKGSKLIQIKAPRQANGIYTLEISAKNRKAQAPIIITKQRTRGMLVVVPNTTWQAGNPVDDEGDGAPNTLDNGMNIQLGRPYAESGIPQGAIETDQLIKSMRKLNLSYTLTTDLDLSTTPTEKLKGFSGMFFAGDARWLSDQAGENVLRFVRSGGVVTVPGRDVLRRSVQLRRGTLRNPSQPTPEDLFGLEVKPFIKPPFTITATTDKIDLFQGTAGRLNKIYDAAEVLFASDEETDLEAEAVTEDGNHRIIVAVQVGKGKVIRLGLGSFGKQLKENKEVQAVLRRIWKMKRS